MRHNSPGINIYRIRAPIPIRPRHLNRLHGPPSSHDTIKLLPSQRQLLNNQRWTADSDVEVNTEVEEGKSVSDEVGGTYLPEFLSESPIGGDWFINVKIANAIQANKQFKKCCFECNSPDHFIKDCPKAKNGRRPQKPIGPHKNQSPSVNGKGKTPSSTHTLQGQQQKSSQEVK